MTPDIPKAVMRQLHTVANMFDAPPKAFSLLLRNVRFDKIVNGWVIDGLPVSEFVAVHQEMRAKREKHGGKHPLSILESAFDHGLTVRGSAPTKLPSLTDYDRRRDPGAPNAGVYNPQTRRK